MREARNWMATFNPKSIDDVMAVMGNFGSKENAYMRQVCGYWEMVAAFIVHGTLNADLAYDTLGEMYFVYGILQPVIEDFRKKFSAPEFFKNVQQVVEAIAEGSRTGRAGPAASRRDDEPHGCRREEQLTFACNWLAARRESVRARSDPRCVRIRPGCESTILFGRISCLEGRADALYQARLKTCRQDSIMKRALAPARITQGIKP